MLVLFESISSCGCENLGVITMVYNAFLNFSVNFSNFVVLCTIGKCCFGQLWFCGESYL